MHGYQQAKHLLQIVVPFIIYFGMTPEKPIWHADFLNVVLAGIFFLIDLL